MTNKISKSGNYIHCRVVREENIINSNFECDNNDKQSSIMGKYQNSVSNCNYRDAK